MALRSKSSDAGKSDISKRSYRMLPMSKKVNILNLIWKEKKSDAGVAKTYSENKTSVCEIVKEKEICASFFFFSVTPHSPTATVHNKCLVKMEKVLNLYKKVF